ncbi:MAG: efflux RND transporter periplasmic adaptor subunit [Rhizobiaceae bacterium]
MHKFAHLLFASVLLSSAATISVAQEVKTEAAAPKAPAVTVVIAQKREIIERLPVTGSVLPRQEVAVGADVSGLLVTELNADIGDMVKAGDVLARLDTAALLTQLAQFEAQEAQNAASKAQTEAQIVDAEIGVRQAQESYDRARKLAKSGVAAPASLDAARNNLDSANAKLNTATQGLAAVSAQAKLINAQKNELKLRIEKADVKAPADGLILARNAQLGAVVSGAGGPLFRIAWTGKFEVVADVPEITLPRIKIGAPTSFTVTGFDAPLQGTVRLIGPEIMTATRLGKVYLTLPDNTEIKPGAFARGEIELVRRVAISVPQSALLYRDKEAYLQVVKDGIVESRTVKSGARAGGFVEISEGLAEGEDVVERAGTFIANGDHVSAIRKEETTGATK